MCFYHTRRKVLQQMRESSRVCRSRTMFGALCVSLLMEATQLEAQASSTTGVRERSCSDSRTAISFEERFVVGNSRSVLVAWNPATECLVISRRSDGKPYALNGSNLVLEGGEMIIEDTVTIVSVPQGARSRKAAAAKPSTPKTGGGRGIDGIPGAKGEVGRSASQARIRIASLGGEGVLRLDFRGGKGQDGQPGGPGGDGAQGAKGVGQACKGESCRNNSTGSPGGLGGNGGLGGDGGDGGKGGRVWVAGVATEALSAGRIVVDVAGGGPGQPGNAGAPGSGGPGGPGGDGSKCVTKYCKGGAPGSAGAPGNPGTIGGKGSRGANGSMTVQPDEVQAEERQFSVSQLSAPVRSQPVQTGPNRVALTKEDWNFLKTLWKAHGESIASLVTPQVAAGLRAGTTSEQVSVAEADWDAAVGATKKAGALACHAIRLKFAAHASDRIQSGVDATGQKYFERIVEILEQGCR